MPSGTVKWFNSQKGYGFIQPQGGGRDVFVHISAVEKAGLSNLNEGQRVQYEEVSNRGKTSVTADFHTDEGRRLVVDLIRDADWCAERASSPPRQIGQVLGVTESRVCQIHTKAVLRLRTKLQERIAG